jgi:hypothetical protein
MSKRTRSPLLGYIPILNDWTWPWASIGIICCTCAVQRQLLIDKVINLGTRLHSKPVYVCVSGTIGYRDEPVLSGRTNH